MNVIFTILAFVGCIGLWLAKRSFDRRAWVGFAGWIAFCLLLLASGVGALRSWSNAIIRVNAMAATRESAIRDDRAFTRPFPMVAIPKGASDAHKLLAHDVAKAIGPDSIGEMDRNPVCCIWIEITGWTPNPGDPGWTIINQPGGSVISASNVEQLRLSVDAFKKSVRVKDRQSQVPVGLMTSYPIRDR